MNRWEEIAALEEVPDGYVELPEQGLAALVAWFAGPGNVVRISDFLGLHKTTLVYSSGGTTSEYERERSQEEQDIVDDDMDEYLAAANLPLRPRGFRWFLRLPAGLAADDLWPRINAHLSTVGPHPVETAAAISEFIEPRFDVR